MYSEGESNITNCNFTNNSATEGVIFAQGQSNIANCNFVKIIM